MLSQQTWNIFTRVAQWLERLTKTQMKDCVLAIPVSGTKKLSLYYIVIFFTAMQTRVYDYS